MNRSQAYSRIGALLRIVERGRLPDYFRDLASFAVPGCAYRNVASIRCQIDRARVSNKASPAPMIKRRPNLINVEGRPLSFAGRLILSSAFGFVTAAARYA